MKKILYVILLICLLSFNAYASSGAYLSADEQAVLDELNMVRTSPSEYAKNYLIPIKATYNGQEGKKALNECIDALITAKPVDKLEPSKGMSQAAADHVNEQGGTGKVGHNGDNGSSPWDRMGKYGTYSGTAGENISYGYSDARKIVIQLLIDDGVPSRGHRKNIMSGDFHYVGIAIGYHSEYDHMCVLDFAGGYTETAFAGEAAEPAPSVIEPVVTLDESVCSTALTDKEKRLYDLIMEYRKSQGLPVIPLSPSLTFVAHAHARDLVEHPPSGNCNGHSWSAYGDWSSCCYTPDHAQAKCMWDKPKELTGYKGSGFEISAWSSGELTPEAALSMWKNSSPHNAVMINTGIWKDADWQAIGIGLYGSRGVVWFGKVKDVCLGK